jgi:hypothetical protein
MRIKKGNDRVVIIFQSLGIVIKLPIIHLFVVIQKCFDFSIRKGRRCEWFIKQLSFSLEDHGGFKRRLFMGLVANWNEFWFYWKTRNPFLQPTYFSLFGILNIQRAGEPCTFSGVDLLSQFNNLTNRETSGDPHHFGNPDNFCFCGGKLKILDYGSNRSREIIAKHGKRIANLFDPDYSWEEEKERLREKRESTA